jgi:hypothetical protein
MLILVNEGTSAKYSTTLLRDDGQPVPLADLNTLTLTLYNKDSGAIINSRNNANVKNAGGGTYHATSGAFDMIFSAADMAALGVAPNAPLVERHVVLFKATWAGNGALNWEVEIDVRNLALVP